MAEKEVLIPDIGDAEDVEVIEILAKVGAQIAKDDPLIVIESDKASMEVPATVAGTLRKIVVALGDKVHAGQAIAVIEAESASGGTGAVTTNPTMQAPTTQRSKRLPNPPSRRAGSRSAFPTSAKLKTLRSSR